MLNANPNGRAKIVKPPATCDDRGLFRAALEQSERRTITLSRHPVNFRILPAPPKIDNLPIVANQGAITQQFVLRPNADHFVIPAGYVERSPTAIQGLYASDRPGQTFLPEKVLKLVQKRYDAGQPEF